VVDHIIFRVETMYLVAVALRELLDVVGFPSAAQESEEPNDLLATIAESVLDNLFEVSESSIADKNFNDFGELLDQVSGSNSSNRSTIDSDLTFYLNLVY
jgi:hypothetical protein